MIGMIERDGMPRDSGRCQAQALLDVAGGEDHREVEGVAFFPSVSDPSEPQLLFHLRGRMLDPGPVSGDQAVPPFLPVVELLLAPVAFVADPVDHPARTQLLLQPGIGEVVLLLEHQALEHQHRVPRRVAGARVVVLGQGPDRGREHLPRRGRSELGQQCRRSRPAQPGQHRVHEPHRLVLPHTHDRASGRPADAGRHPVRLFMRGGCAIVQRFQMVFGYS